MEKYVHPNYIKSSKTVVSIVLSLFIGTGTCLAQESMIDGKLVRLNGLKFNSGKGEIVANFGKPKKVSEPNYECGFHSEAEQGNRFYQLTYDHIVFIGNASDGYDIESIEFSPNSDLTLHYGQFTFTHKLTKDEFIIFFGNTIKNRFDDNGNGITDIFLYFKNKDDGLIFTFKSGYLAKVAYWSPC
ncbi:hypothetical protein ACMA1I_22080 [Pontibacter sp. 13R65]|uniref:hypothetical protein n=1 Tax=Pontibacter sp. 13R65 TaxID=3127458 RepID=UPI00301E3F62